MKFSVGSLNLFLMFKLPTAFIAGVRVKRIDTHKCVVGVKHRWINQNPFQSMYFAVQAMAAELTTGVLIMQAIQESGQSISMLVLNNKSNFSKKAKGLITFTCEDGEKISDIVRECIQDNISKTIWISSIGIDETGHTVSKMDFEWTLKLKK
jgi:hypothetical protein